MKKWYPSHINEAKKNLLDNLAMCDTVIEVIDARSPFASKNKELEKLTKGKNRILVLNKVDLIEDKIADNLIKHFKGSYRYVLTTSAKHGKNMKKLFQILEDIYNRKKEKMLRKKVRALPIRVIILGIPNVGKSRIINSVIGKKIAGVGDRPGFTRGKQWVRVMPNVDLLDTPGILWTNSGENELKKLAILGSLKDSFHNMIGATHHLIEIISKSKLEKVYEVELSSQIAEEIVYELSTKWNKSEEEVYKKIIGDFRKGTLGLISLESA